MSCAGSGVTFEASVIAVTDAAEEVVSEIRAKHAPDANGPSRRRGGDRPSPAQSLISLSRPSYF